MVLCKTFSLTLVVQARNWYETSAFRSLNLYSWLSCKSAAISICDHGKCLAGLKRIAADIEIKIIRFESDSNGDVYMKEKKKII